MCEDAVGLWYAVGLLQQVNCWGSNHTLMIYVDVADHLGMIDEVLYGK